MQDHEPLQRASSKKRAWRRILVGLGVVLALVILGLLLSAFWITPGERRSARLALTMIDEIEEIPSLGGLDSGLLSEIEQPSREALKSAQQAAWTYRDVKISWQLQTYFLTVEQELSARRLTGIILEGNTAPRSDGKCGAAKSDETRAVCLALHKALD
jgi:autotransporter translocation and assembly factor TamB